MYQDYYDNKNLTLESIKHMHIDNIIDLYKKGYRLESTIQSLQLVDTRIIDFSPTAELYAKSNISFKGLLQYYNESLQFWAPIGPAPIDVKIKNIYGNILGTVIGVTSTEIFNPGRFETTPIYIPDSYANNDIIVEASFSGGESGAGGGTAKPSTYYTTYHILGICPKISPRTGECQTDRSLSDYIILGAVIGVTALIGYKLGRKK